MEPRESKKLLQVAGDGQIEPPRQPERKPRFQIVKLEERIAPGAHNTRGIACHAHTDNCR